MRSEDIIWLFGCGRTGSTWLSRMVNELPGFTHWQEPLLGKLFGDLWWWSGSEMRSDNAHYAMPRELPELWAPQVRSFVLALAEARFPQAKYLFVKEPNGAQGAEPLLRAMPESRLVFLLRDPRDVVASFLDGFSVPGGWGNMGRPQDNRARDNPDRFVKQRARAVARSFRYSWEAYSGHEGPKVKVRYEDMRADPLKTVARLLRKLDLPVPWAELRAAVDKWSWENPDFPLERGPGTKLRKASPGSWREDLTPGQSRTVEEVCRPILRAFY